jgi:hypothetical protein
VSEVIYLGSKSVGGCMPSTLTAVGALEAQLPSLQAQVAGLIALQARLNLTPPSIGASLDAALELVAALQAAIAIGVSGPDFQLAAVLELLAKLQIELGSITAALAISVSLGASGVHLYAYTGEAAQLGSAFQSELASGFPGGQPDDEAYAIMLATTTPATKICLLYTSPSPRDH